MSPQEIEEAFAGPHQAVISVSRESRGPVAAPMSFLFVNGLFKMIIMPDSFRGRLMQATGRVAVLTPERLFGYVGESRLERSRQSKTPQ